MPKEFAITRIGTRIFGTLRTAKLNTLIRMLTDTLTRPLTPLPLKVTPSRPRKTAQTQQPRLHIVIATTTPPQMRTPHMPRPSAQTRTHQKMSPMRKPQMPKTTPHPTTTTRRPEETSTTPTQMSPTTPPHHRRSYMPLGSPKQTQSPKTETLTTTSTTPIATTRTRPTRTTQTTTLKKPATRKTGSPETATQNTPQLITARHGNDMRPATDRPENPKPWTKTPTAIDTPTKVTTKKESTRPIPPTKAIPIGGEHTTTKTRTPPTMTPT